MRVATDKLTSTRAHPDWRLRVMAGWHAYGLGPVLRALARLAAVFTAVFVARKNRAFNTGRRAPTRLSIPVICVGNITTGGTGKTPMVAYIVDRLRDLGRNPAIVSRGYMAGADATNDEARLLHDLLPDTPHIQDPDRVRGGQRAIAEHGADVLVLDDGFSHRRLHRDLDLVLIDATEPFGYGYLLPRGLLREPPTSLRRASAIAITRSDQLSPDRLREIEVQLREHIDATTPIFRAKHEPARVVALNSTGVSPVPPPLHGAQTDARHDSASTPHSNHGGNGQDARATSSLTDARVVAFAGIGNPAAFERTIDDLGANVKAFKAFPDHHAYTARDIADVQSLAREHDAAACITTAKDAVKLRDLATDDDPPILVLEIALAIDDPASLTDLLTATLNRHTT